jgi:ASPIC/UnbV protein/VCBS repeat protein
MRFSYRHRLLRSVGNAIGLTSPLMTTRVFAGFLAALACGAASSVTPQADATAPSTRAMAALLRERAAQVEPAGLLFIVNDRRAELIRRNLDGPLTPAESMSRRFDYATELLNAGRIDDALAAIVDLEQRAQALNPAGYRRAASRLLVLKAMAHLRQAELQNCNDSHSRQSCLLPIRGSGVHTRREGSEAAIRVLSGVLATEPENLKARWLMNVAHMTLGQYPSGVPAQALIPPSAFAPGHPLPRYPNVAIDVGLGVNGLSGGAVMEDFDRDGRLDLLLSAIGFEDPLKLFHLKDDGHYENVAESAGLAGLTGGLNLIQADFDNDGWTDFLVMRGGWMGREARFPLSLVRNNGDGTFADVTEKAGLMRAGPTQTSVFVDYDGDGRLDLYVGYESDPANLQPCALYRNNGDGTFTDVAKEVGVDALGFVKGVVSADYDHDGRPDLFLSVAGGANILFHNDGPQADGRFRFTDVAARAGVTGPKDTFPATFFDYDNDGWPDIFVAAYGATIDDVTADLLGLPTPADRSRLYRNRGDGTFADVTREAGLYRVTIGMGLNHGDLDNDGFLDLYVGTGNPDLTTLVPNLLFRNDGGRRFQDVTTAVDAGHLQKGHGIAFGDLDDDGDQDLFEEMGGAYLADRAWSALYLNPGNANTFVGLELEGVRANRSAIGARVAVTVESDAGPRTIHRTVGSGGSFGASPLRLEIGLGAARRIRAVEIVWPGSGARQAVDGLEPGRRYRVREGEPVREVKRVPIRLAAE